jgi:hypothetical protein
VGPSNGFAGFPQAVESIENRELAQIAGRSLWRGVGTGSCFYFSLPMATAVLSPRSNAPKRTQRSTRTPVILAIEADHTAAHLLEAQLTSSGYQAVACATPECALEIAAELQPHAIALHLLMKL